MIVSKHDIARYAVSTVSCLMSILGSAAVIYVTRRNWQTVYNRQVTILSLSDLIFTLSFLGQPWFMKREDSLIASLGTTQTCTAIGFLGVHF